MAGRVQGYLLRVPVLSASRSSVRSASYSRRGRILTLTGSQAIGTAFRNLVIEARDVWRGEAVTMPSRTEPGVAGLLPLSLFKVTHICNSEGYVIFE